MIHPDRPTAHPDSFVVVNTFVPLPDRLDELITLQVAETRALAPLAVRHGWHGNRLYRERDGRNLVVVTAFASADDHRRWLATDEFARHRRDLGSLVADVRSVPCDLVAAHGNV